MEEDSEARASECQVFQVEEFHLADLEGVAEKGLPCTTRILCAAARMGNFCMCLVALTLLQSWLALVPGDTNYESCS
jgi:hypothetical protein